MLLQCTLHSHDRGSFLRCVVIHFSFIWKVYIAPPQEIYHSDRVERMSDASLIDWPGPYGL